MCPDTGQADVAVRSWQSEGGVSGTHPHDMYEPARAPSTPGDALQSILLLGYVDASEALSYCKSCGV